MDLWRDKNKRDEAIIIGVVILCIPVLVIIGAGLWLVRKLNARRDTETDST